MNVYEKLTPNYRKQLDKHVELYPNSYGSVKKDLVDNDFINTLRYSTFASLNGMDMLTPALSSMYDFCNDI